MAGAYEGSSLRVLVNRSLEVVETPSCKSGDASLGSLNDSKRSIEGDLLSKEDWNCTGLNEELEVEKGEGGISKRDLMYSRRRARGGELAFLLLASILAIIEI